MILEVAVKDRDKSVLSVEFTSQSTKDLLGRQSVRTTFKLSERSIDALSILASQLGIKQKSLFDHLIDDDSVLRGVAEEAEGYEAPEQRVPKTYVISRRTLKNLEKASNKYQAPRDALVELKKLLKKLNELLDGGNQLFDMASRNLDHDDPVYRRIHQMMKTVKGCYDEVYTCVERGRKIEEF